MDYFLVGTGSGNALLPMIALREREMVLHGASALPAKGVTEYALAFLLGWFKSLGYRCIVVRSDNERALLALLQRVSRVLDGAEWIPAGQRTLGGRRAGDQEAMPRSDLAAGGAPPAEASRGGADIRVDLSTCRELHEPLPRGRGRPLARAEARGTSVAKTFS